MGAVFLILIYETRRGRAIGVLFFFVFFVLGVGEVGSVGGGWLVWRMWFGMDGCLVGWLEEVYLGEGYLDCLEDVWVRG